MTTGDRIRQLRIEHQMTQEELGAKVGVQKAAIYKYENGLVVNLKRSVLEKLALVLDTTPTYLMGMEESEHHPHSPLSSLLCWRPLTSSTRRDRPRPWSMWRTLCLPAVIKNVLRLSWAQKKRKK